jgi:hypothetical protein
MFAKSVWCRHAFLQTSLPSRGEVITQTGVQSQNSFTLTLKAFSIVGVLFSLI